MNKQHQSPDLESYDVLTTQSGMRLCFNNKTTVRYIPFIVMEELLKKAEELRELDEYVSNEQLRLLSSYIDKYLLDIENEKTITK